MPSGFSRVRLFATLWTVSRQAPLSMGFSRQEDWSGLPCPPLGGSSQPRNRSQVSHIAGGFFTTEPPGSWRRQWHPTPDVLPGKSHGWRSLVGCSHGVAESWTGLSDFTFTFHFPALEKEMATHSGVLAWRIPGKGEPGGLPFLGSHRVGHD